MECISEQDLDEMNIEIIRNTLYKVIYIDDIMPLLLGLSTSQKFSSVVFQNALKAKWLTEANIVVIVHDSLTLLFMVGVVDLHSSLPRFKCHYDPCFELFFVQFFEWDPFENFGLSLQNQIAQCNHCNSYCKIALYFFKSPLGISRRILQVL